MMNLAEIRMRDPYVLPLPDEGRYLLFGTTDPDPWAGPATGFDVYTSRDLNHWEGPLPAFRPPPRFWADTQFWAPECHRWRGRYYLFASFTRTGGRRGTQILTADRPEGPYVPHSEGPVTPRDWMSIDGTLFADEVGRPWMVFCHEWVQIEDGEIHAMPLTEDLRDAAGPPRLLFRASEAEWSRPFQDRGRSANRVTDDPFLHRLTDGTLLMLWSSFGSEGYAMGFAVSESGGIPGPWRQMPQPLYGKDGGHGMLFRGFDGLLRMTLHYPNRSPMERPIWLPVTERDGTLTIADNGMQQG